MLRTCFALAASLAGCGSVASGSAADASDPCAPYRRYPCATSVTGLCDENGNPAPPRTAQQQEYIATHCVGDGG
jgi:hypothetical protein